MQVRQYLGAAVVAASLVVGGCSSPPDPIVVEDGTITVDNQTSRDWRNVMITVNDHFRGGAQALAAHGRLNAPLSQFQTAYGQRFERARQGVTKIEVTATDSAGEPVKLVWPLAKE
jgi:hypothetical protein